jgi:Tol biopolymer transport system component
MSKTKKAILIFTAIIILACGGLIVYKAIDPVYLLPQPVLGQGVSKIMGIDAGEGLIWSPDGKYLAGLIRDIPMPDCYFCGESYSEIFIVDAKTWEKHTLSKTKFHEKDVWIITWLPNSKRIAYVPSIQYAGEESKIWSIDIYGQNNAPIIQEDASPAWSPDGSKIALLEKQRISGNSISLLYILDSSTQKKQLLYKSEGPEFFINNISWTPDGKKIIFAYGQDQHYEILYENIFYIDLESKEISQLTNDAFEYSAAEYSPTNNLIALQRVNDAADFNHKYMTVLRDLTNNCEVELPILYTHSASWSPDGKKLVISGGRKAYILDLTKYFGTKFTETGSICP